MIFEFFLLGRPGPKESRPKSAQNEIGPPFYRARLSPTAWSGLSPAQKQKAGYYAKHNNQLIILHFAAERELLTFYMQMENTTKGRTKARGKRRGEYYREWGSTIAVVGGGLRGKKRWWRWLEARWQLLCCSSFFSTKIPAPMSSLLLFFFVFLLYSVPFLPPLSLFFSSLLPPFSSFLLWLLCIISLSLSSFFFREQASPRNLSLFKNGLCFFLCLFFSSVLTEPLWSQKQPPPLWFLFFPPSSLLSSLPLKTKSSSMLSSLFCPLSPLFQSSSTHSLCFHSFFSSPVSPEKPPFYSSLFLYLLAGRERGHSALSRQGAGQGGVGWLLHSHPNRCKVWHVGDSKPFCADRWCTDSRPLEA